jgi:hypothetical protein
MLIEKPLVRTCKLPPLFKAIIENDEQRRINMGGTVVKFAEFKRLQTEHKDFMLAAEKATAGTKDKGKTSA